ncbi:MAG: YidC/Oxa1 family membrane protein insertase, partial [Firmicutes bacterium]|nr:YidC/Oxa1 family membrane protein insertase [Bacillota bacterium]
LAFVPIDFITKYFGKKNQIKMAELKPEHDKLRAIYKGDPMTLQREMAKVNKKHGYNMGSFALVTLGSMVLMIFIFFGVFSAITDISNRNITHQYKEAEKVWLAGGTNQQVADTYADNQTSFLWINNIWRPDTWASKTLSYEDYKGIQGNGNQNKQDYQDVMRIVEAQYKNTGWNGWFILVVLAGVATWGSAKINMSITNKRIALKKEKAEIETYSIREVKDVADTSVPTVDPAQIAKIMQFVLPSVMVVFSFVSNSAFAIYLITSGIASTLSTVGLGFIIDAIIKNQEKKKEEQKEQETIINPRTKYFKNTK